MKTKLKENVWYVIGKEDKSSPYGYKQVTPKGQYFTTLPEAQKALNDMDEFHRQIFQTRRYFIFKRTCTVLK